METTSDIKLKQEIAALSSAISHDPQNAALYVERGKLHWSLGHRGNAMSDYQHAAALDPSGPGALLAEHSNNIMDFFNPDLLNP